MNKETNSTREKLIMPNPIIQERVISQPIKQVLK